jgi:hypothetical protein
VARALVHRRSQIPEVRPACACGKLVVFVFIPRATYHMTHTCDYTPITGLGVRFSHFKCRMARYEKKTVGLTFLVFFCLISRYHKRSQLPLASGAGAGPRARHGASHGGKEKRGAFPPTQNGSSRGQKRGNPGSGGGGQKRGAIFLVFGDLKLGGCPPPPPELR